MVRVVPKCGIFDIILHFIYRCIYITLFNTLYIPVSHFTSRSHDLGSVLISTLSGVLLHSQLMASQQGGDEGVPSQGSLSQEVVGQLSQATLSMTQLTEGSNRLQACRCVSVTCEVTVFALCDPYT